MDSGKQEDRKSNPRERANLFSFLTFAYTFGLFKRGLKGNLQEADIYAIPDDCDSKYCGDKTELEWKQNKTLIKLLWKRFGLRYSILTAFNLLWTMFNSIVHPHITSKFISYFQSNSKIGRNDAYFYAGSVVALSVIHCFWAHNYFMLQCKLELQIKASLTSLIYRKVLKLRPGEISETSMGNIVTILTKDIKLIVHNIWTVSELIVGSIQTVTVFYLLYAKMGPPSTIAMGMLFTGLVVQVFLSKTITNMRIKVGKMADKRLQLTQEALSALRIIKMYTWEIFFNERIYEARRKEMQKTMTAFYLKIVLILIGIMGSKITFPVLLISYVALGYSTNTELVFYILGLFKELRHSVGIAIPLGLSRSAEFYASLSRVSRMLHIEEHYVPQACSTLEKGKDKGKIEFKDVSVSVGKENILKQLNLSLSDAGLNIVTGLVGSGKSSLLKAILRDYRITRGSLIVNGSISYASQDPWLFPSSIKQNILFGLPLDPNRYNEVIKVCCLEYDFSLLPNGDETIVIDGGMNLSKGQQARVNLARAIYKDSDIYLLDDSLAALDVKVQEDIFQKCIRQYLKRKLVIFVSQNPEYFKSAGTVVFLNRGTVKSVSKPAEIFSEDIEEIKQQILMDVETCKEKKLIDLMDIELDDKKVVKKKVYQEEKKSGSVDFNTYWKYINFGGGIVIFSLIMCIYLAAQFTDSYSSKLLSKWVDYQQQAFDIGAGNNVTLKTNETLTYDSAVERRDWTFNLFSILIFASAIFSLFKAYSILRFCRRASVKIHEIMCQCVIGSLMSFMDNHFIGNILNRFSYDLDVIDELYPFIFMEFFRSFISIGGMLILIATISWIFLLFALGFFVALYVLRMVYMPTGRALKRLEAMTRSPLVGHLNASVEGLTTIRAYKAEEVLKIEFDKHQDLANSTYYMLMTTSRAFAYILDFAGAMFVVFIIAMLLFADTHTSVGDVGLALTQVMMLTAYLQWAVRQWADLENCMTSVERVLEYTEVQQEDMSGGAVNDWPKDGHIKYDNVSLAYNAENRVLKNISFTVKPQEKIGICGRTGAGKSSIISTLFRLYKFEGKILIDDLDTSSVSVNFLRKSISIIPQDPVIFEGSVRANIDPYKVYTDQEIWLALEKVKVKDLIPSLDEDITDLNLSSGQKQLLSLARAVIRKNKIVVLDEATANMDEESDELVHKLIRENFSNCTVIMIAHRLSTILDCDRVMVLDKGEIAEFDDPRVLLADKGSLFYSMKNQPNAS